MLIQALVIWFSFLSQSKGQRSERFRDRRKRLGRETCANIIFVHAVLGCVIQQEYMGLAKVWLFRRLRRLQNFRSKIRLLIMKMPQRVILLQLERKPLFVYTTAGLTKVWIRYDIRDSARRSQQELCLYISNVSLQFLHPRSSTGTKDWGWKLVDGSLQPVRTDLPAAHASLLEIIRCRKHGLDCSATRGNCRGQS